jgi:hypothetical protein
MDAFEFPREAVKKVDRERVHSLPLVALQGVGAIRAYLRRVEEAALPLALESGATLGEIAEALGITKQAVNYKVKKLEKAAGEDTPSVRLARAPRGATEEPRNHDHKDGGLHVVEGEGAALPLKEEP